jgi:uncharacterized damage-inducible protein DinB
MTVNQLFTKRICLPIHYFCVMKAYFTQLFNYDHHTNHLLLASIIAADSPPEPVKSMAHVLGAQQVWLSRCTGDPSIGNIVWPDWQVNQLSQIIDDNHQAWVNYLNTLSEINFERIISYKTSRGAPYENKLVDILTHVINHGTHHRAQMGQLLKFGGAETLPPTDYILYVRD